MNVNDVIEAYVTDVAVRLPRRQRNDVAFELRALLDEELHAKAEASGRAPDADMAIEFLRAFGRPQDVAARYRPALNIIDPADGQRFVRLAIVGLVVIWCAGLLQYLSHAGGSGWDILTALGQWWGAVVIPSLWWPGVLAAVFSLAAWKRRRWPAASNWKPLSPDRIQGGRAAIVAGLIGMLCGLFILIEPRWLLDVVWGGRAAPAAYLALTYTDSFLRLQAPVLLALVAINVPLFAVVLAMGRWPAALRRAASLLGLLTCAAMLWTIFDGPIFMTATSDQTAKFFMLVIVAITLADLGIKYQRGVSPMPNRQAGA